MLDSQACRSSREPSAGGPTNANEACDATPPDTADAHRDQFSLRRIRPESASLTRCHHLRSRPRSLAYRHGPILHSSFPNAASRCAPAPANYQRTRRRSPWRCATPRCQPIHDSPGRHATNHRRRTFLRQRNTVFRAHPAKGNSSISRALPPWHPAQLRPPSGPQRITASGR